MTIRKVFIPNSTLYQNFRPKQFISDFLKKKKKKRNKETNNILQVVLDSDRIKETEFSISLSHFLSLV